MAGHQLSAVQGIVALTATLWSSPAGATKTSTAAELLPAAALYVRSSTSAAPAEPGPITLTEAEPPPPAAAPSSPLAFTLAAGLASHSPFQAGAGRADGLEGQWALGVPVQLGAEWSRVQAGLGLTFGSQPFDLQAPGGWYQTSPELRLELLGRYLFESEDGLTPFVGLKAGWRRTSLAYRSDDAFEGCVSFRFDAEETVCFGLEGVELERTIDGFSVGPLVGVKQELGSGSGVSWSLLAEGWLEATHWTTTPRYQGPYTEENLDRALGLEKRRPDAPAFDLGIRLLLEARIGEASGVRVTRSSVAMFAALGAQALVPIGSGGQGSRASLVAPLLLGLQVGERLEVALELGLGSGAFDLAPFGESAAGGIQATTTLEQHLLVLGRYTLYDGARSRPFVGVRGGLRRERHELTSDGFLEACAGIDLLEASACGPLNGTKIRYELGGLQLGPVVGLRQVVLQNEQFGLNVLAEAFGNFTFWRVDTDWLGGVGPGTRAAYRALVSFEPERPTFELGGRVLIEGAVGLF